MAQAAYNLCVITLKDRINEAVLMPQGSRTQSTRPQIPLYASFLSHSEESDRDEALRNLKAIIEK
jgi:hypothetical protein